MELGQAAKSKAATGSWRHKLRQALCGGAPQFDCLQVEVSSRCLGRCIYCPRTQAVADPGVDMPLATFSRLGPMLTRARRVHLQG